MSWREHADLAQEVILDTMSERDPLGSLSVFLVPERGATPRAVRGIFREPHVDQILDPLTVPASVWQPILGVKIAELLPDWPLKQEARFLIRRPAGGDPLDDSAETSYAVIDRRLDGEGMAELLLQRKD